MNTIMLNGKIVDDVNDLKQFNIKIDGEDNTLKLNDFDGPALVYIYIKGNNCKFSFGKNNFVRNDISVNFWDTETNEPDAAEITIGNENYFNGDRISIISPLDKKIIIGDRNLFAGNICFWGRNDHIIYSKKNLKRLNYDKDILIGNSNWICQNVSFLPGAIIESESVVGYGSLINKKFNKSNVLIAGIPAKIKRKNIKWSRSTDYDRIDYENFIKIKERK